MKQNKTPWFWLVLILLIGCALRFYGINFGKPFSYHPDEAKLIAQAGRLLDTKFIDKRAYFGIGVYPPFYTYLLAMIMGGYIGFGLLIGHFESLQAVRVAYQCKPFQFFLLSRSLVALFGIISIFIIYLIGTRLRSKYTGLFAALLIAVAFVHVRNSHFGTVDVPATFFGLLTFYFSLRIVQQGYTKDYILAALFLALATATKFSMAVFSLLLIFAHFTRFEPRNWGHALFSKRIWLAIGIGLLFFLFACPLIWLDLKETWGGILGTGRFEKVGKIGSGGGLFSYWTGDQSPGISVFYPNSIPHLFNWFYTALFLASVIYLLLKHGKEELLLFIGIVSTYLLFERMSIKAMRHILPIIPLLVTAVAILISDFAMRIKITALRSGMLLLLVGYLSLSQTFKAVSYHQKLSEVDPRTLASAWINANLPHGASLAMESFPPFLFTDCDSTPFNLYETNWTSRSMMQEQAFFDFLAQQDSVYYIADDFTRQIFSWKYTLLKYPELAKDRLKFFQWLKTNAEQLKVFRSRNPSVQPTIWIYCVKSSDIPKTDSIPIRKE